MCKIRISQQEFFAMIRIADRYAIHLNSDGTAYTFSDGSKIVFGPTLNPPEDFRILTPVGKTTVTGYVNA
jgi:hypothetical protein